MRRDAWRSRRDGRKIDLHVTCERERVLSGRVARANAGGARAVPVASR